MATTSSVFVIFGDEGTTRSRSPLLSSACWGDTC
jgi:hypothetical protein